MIFLYLAGGVMTGAVAGFLRPIGRTLGGAMLVGVISAIPISIMLAYVLTMHTELQRHLFGIVTWMSLAGAVYGASVWIWDHKRS